MNEGAGLVLGRLAMVAGAALIVGGLGLRMGVVGLPAAGGLPGVVAVSSAPVANGTPAATDTPPATAPSAAAMASPRPTPTPILTAPPSTTPEATPALPTPWFADDFDAVAAWPTGNLDWLTAEIVEGRYRIDARATDLPVVVLAAAGEGSPGAEVAVHAWLEISSPADPASGAGIVLEAIDGTRYLVLLAADGRVTVFRDTMESFDGLASGTTAPPSGIAELRVTASAGTLTAAVGSTPVVSVRVAVTPVAVGLAAWAVGGGATVSVDRYEVWSLDSDG